MGDAVTWNAYLAESVNSSVSFIPLFDVRQEGIRVGPARLVLYVLAHV